MTFVLDCPICLEKLNVPVAIPCGHLCCDACIKTYARRSNDPYKATCPTCRAPFSLVTPNMSIVPKKYHTFISPSLRRVFLDAREDNSPEVISSLNTENSALKERVMVLECDNGLLTDCCESARTELAILSADEQTARAEALENKENLDRLGAMYDALASRARTQVVIQLEHGFGLKLFIISIFVSTSLMLYHTPECWAIVKRMTGQA